MVEQHTHTQKEEILKNQWEFGHVEFTKGNRSTGVDVGSLEMLFWGGS